MLNPELHDALSAFAEEAAAHLAAETAAGAEVPFEIVMTERPRRTPLYCYRPLVTAFIDERVGVLAQLPSYLRAVQALSSAAGLPVYLEARGVRPLPIDPQEQVAATVRAFLARIFEDAADFELVPARVERACAELEEIVADGGTEAAVMAPVLGLTLESGQVPLGEGLALVRGEVLADAPPDAVADDTGVVAVLRWEAGSGDDRLDHARKRFRALQTALRLYGGPGLRVAPLAWTRLAGGPWRTVSLTTGSGRPHEAVAVRAAQEDELRAFCNLVGRRMPRMGELAWALARFEMGCERAAPFEALTDHLLALHALLAPEGGGERLGRRVAALCAPPERRAALAERVAHAVSLERGIIAGVAPDEAGVIEIVNEVAGHLRAILRDVLCGHLDSDVRTLAERIIAEAEEAKLA